MSKREDVIKELQREQAERKVRYPKQISGGDLDSDRANRRYQLVDSVIKVLHGISDWEYHIMEDVGEDKMNRQNQGLKPKNEMR